MQRWAFHRRALEIQLPGGLTWKLPFRQMELLARIKSMLTWRTYSEAGESVVWGTFVLNPGLREVTKDNKKIVLTNIECEIMHELIKSSPAIVSYDSLVRKIWGDDFYGSRDSIKVHIRRLREKVEHDPSKPKIILTKMHIGYCAIRPA